MKRTILLKFLIVFSTLIYCCSCSLPPQIKPPVFKRSYDALVEELWKLGKFEQIAVKSSASKKNGKVTEYNIDITLTNGQAEFSNEAAFNSLAKDAAAIVRNNVLNINDYKFLTIIFDGTINNQLPVKNIYIFEPGELKQ